MMPEQLLNQLTSSDYVAFGIGAILLLFGRKLFWLSLGGLGFLVGLWISSQALNLTAGPVALVIALCIGMAGALLAFVAQKLAVAVGGMVLGGAGALWIGSFFEASLQGQSQVWILAIAVVGAVIGAALAPSLFETSLAATTSVVGAMMIVAGSGVGPTHQVWLLPALAIVGLFLQTRSPRRRIRHVKEPARA